VKSGQWPGKQIMDDNKKANDYRDLLVWQKGLGLTKQIYQLTQSLPNEERYGLTSQIRRAAVSVPSNIAEGQARSGKKEFIHFLYVARGSLAEIDTQCIIAKDLGYISQNQHMDIYKNIDELKRMLYSLIGKLSGSR
jgi:four helix bundle protein